MPKKKSFIKNCEQDVTINDSANAPKPVTRLKKAAALAVVAEPAWDEIFEDEFDIIEELNADGTKKFVYRKRKHQSKLEDYLEKRPGKIYPEIVWYHISRYIKPEDVARFAGINKTTYAITKLESFWRMFYKRYCEKHPKLPEKLRLDNSYGLRQRVIRAMHHTYDIFVKKETNNNRKTIHQLTKHICTSVWYCKGSSYWLVYFKFRKVCPLQRINMNKEIGFIEELGRIDANPDEDTLVLQMTCQDFYEIPPMMGMTLSSVNVMLAQGFNYHKVVMGFHSSRHVSKDTLPEQIVVFSRVILMVVYDWWHPNYPHFENKLPQKFKNDEESVTVLKKDFFT